MSVDSLDQLRTGSKAGLTRALGLEKPSAAPEAEPDEEACPAFGYLRGIADRSPSIEFRFADGNSESFPYSWLGPVQYNRSAGILLKFAGDLIYLVLIEGSNLNVRAAPGSSVSLYDRGILRHRVIWVQEMTRRDQEQAGEGAVTIEHIRIVRHKADEEPQGVEWLKPFLDRS